MNKQISCVFCGKYIDENTEVCPHCGGRIKWNRTVFKENTAFDSSEIGVIHFNLYKSRRKVFIFCLFFGIFGFHRFYVGRKISGFIMAFLFFFPFLLHLPYYLINERYVLSNIDKFYNFGLFSLISELDIGIFWCIYYIWWINDLINILKGEFTDKEKRKIVRWDI